MELSAAERCALAKNQAELKAELAIDTKLLSERSQVKVLHARKQALERKLTKVQDDNRALDKRLADERHTVDKLIADAKEIRSELKKLDHKIDVDSDKKYEFNFFVFFEAFI